MGEGQSKQLNYNKCSSNLRQAISRINIHRGKKLNQIAKKKDDIAKHLEAGNEVNAKIWAETLINEENLIPCFDIISIMCDQLNGRLKSINKFGPPKDMAVTFHTIIYAAPRMEIDELMYVRKQLGNLLGKEFVIQSDTDESCVNKIIVQNINLKIPEEGEKILKLVTIAKERNIDYKPSPEAQQELMCYIDRKGLDNPMGHKAQTTVVIVGPPPQYLPPGYMPPPSNDPPHDSFIPPPPPPFYGGGAPDSRNGYPTMGPQPQQFSYDQIPPQAPPQTNINVKVEEQFNYSYDPHAQPPPQGQPNVIVVENPNPPSFDDLEARLNNLKKL